MLRKFFKIAFFLIICLTPLLNTQAYAENKKTIKVAVFDSLYNEKTNQDSLLDSNFVQAYKAGIETADYAIKGNKYAIKYKVSIYGKGPIDVLKEASQVENWNPDLIIGPSSSDNFLMLRNSFQNVMVLSSYASDINLKTLPKNFYSLFLPDDQLMKLLAEYVHDNYPNKNIYLIAQIDSKQCVDVSKLFAQSYKSISPSTKISDNNILFDNIEKINSKTLMKGHQSDVILIFAFTNRNYNALVEHITKDFPGKHFIFISDQDNWDNKGNSKNITISDLPYDSYRIGPILFDNNDKQFKAFEKNYIAVQHQKPVDGVSYLTYLAVMSAIEAMEIFPPPSTIKSMRKKILYSYTAALNKNPNWFRTMPYGIYQLTSKGEMLVHELPIKKIISK